MLRSKRVFGVLMLCVVLFSSCGGASGDRRTVGVKSINTDIGLGVKVQLGAPANIVVAQPQQRRQPDQRIPQFTLPPIEQPTPEPNRPCPPAGDFDFPAKETGTVITGRPPAGDYPWKIEGTVVGGSGSQDIDEFETRKIFGVADDSSSADAFTFKQTQTFLIDDRRGAGTLTTTYRVVPTSPAQTDTTRTDAGRGVFIVSIVFEGKDEQGRTVTSSFQPASAVQLIAFPVKDGAGVGGTTPTAAGSTPIPTSSGTDPRTGAQLTITGLVKGKKQVDACGERVDSWFTDATQKFTYTDDRTGQTETLESNYDYSIATQYGGMLIYEHTQAPLDGPSVKIESRIGKVPGTKG